MINKTHLPRSISLRTDTADDGVGAVIQSFSLSLLSLLIDTNATTTTKFLCTSLTSYVEADVNFR